MRIGILTFHCAHNYGAVLQCYALQEFLCRKGYDVEVINYRPSYLVRPYALFAIERILYRNPILVLKRILVEILIFKTRYKRWRRFNKFIKNNLLQGMLVDKVSIPSDCDVYIVGSDQIWNSDITCGFDSTYFCDFEFPKGTKKYISYAASKGSTQLSDREIKLYEKNLNNFDSISVREPGLKKVLQSFTSKSIKCVLDPTLLASVDIWDKFIQSDKSQDKYVLVYQVRKHEKTIEIANHIAKQLGAEVKILVPYVERNLKKAYQDAAPEDFVNLIRSASCVVTTSFHGTAFSVIFNVPFYTIKLDDRLDSRSLSLLQALGLEDRAISIDALPTFVNVDYMKCNEKLDRLRQESGDFLLKSLND